MNNLTTSAFAILVIAATLRLTATVILATAQQASAANCLGKVESEAARTRDRYGQDYLLLLNCIQEQKETKYRAFNVEENHKTPPFSLLFFVLVEKSRTKHSSRTDRIMTSLMVVVVLLLLLFLIESKLL